MADDTDVLIKFCEDEWTQGRQSENQRAMMTNFIIVLFGIAFGFIIKIGFVEKALPIAIMIIFIGIFGALASAKFYERWKFHRKRVSYLKSQIDKLHPDALLQDLSKRAFEEHQRKKILLSKIPLHWFWYILNITFSLTGIVCVMAIIVGKS